ncbi:uncharacterized protein BXZ73DRAFT_50322 [Epithele typhae]|uniref:uncharacterized protein n=1 Tax=Epithele typhae TaxID=378194 RepID=UPI0020078931|nr:uncharacterized protein BXZ73DRAFT_50322 [Epithele typhae]KAH9925054.1 hypothetical protein BXZ73DRAFT_50322 [Epithele typhae]
MDHFTRTELLQVLSSIGVELPKNTKLPDNELSKRLRDALNLAQEKDTLPPTFDVEKMKKWPLFDQPSSKENSAGARKSKQSLLEAMKRSNLGEAFQNALTGNKAQPDLYKDVFTDLRQTVMNVANNLDAGHKAFILHDPKQQQCAVNVRIVSVVYATESAPAIVVLFRAFTRENAMEGMAWAQAQARIGADGVRSLHQIYATPIEQKLFLRLLAANASCLPAGFDVDRQAIEESYKLSVILPLGPLDFTSIGKLNNDAGCYICGAPKASRCGQCQSVSYCSQECQRADWGEHKQTCKSLKGGSWRTVVVRSCLPGTEDLYMITFNKYDRPRMEDADGIQKLKDMPIPPNVWGNKLFLLKLQVGLGGTSPQDIMMYDRKRSLRVFMVPLDNPEAFRDFVTEMLQPSNPYGGIKMYRWARRTGDWEFSICMDREPTMTVMW